MERKEIFEKLTEIFVDIIDDGDIELNDNTTADDIDGWDSLTQIQLVVQIEKTFNIKFTSIEIRTFANVGEMVDSIMSKIK